MKRYRVVGYDESISSGEFREDDGGAWMLADEVIAREAELIAALRHARDEIASFPRSLGYEITALPKINAVREWR